MYKIKNNIITLEFQGLKVEKLASKNGCETMLIALEKGHIFPEHTSPRDALLIVLEGEIELEINSNVFNLKKHESFNFPADIVHKVFAIANSKFLIIR